VNVSVVKVILGCILYSELLYKFPTTVEFDVYKTPLK